jgi:anti-sigma factor RsiW
MGPHVDHLLNDYCDNELSPASRRQVEAHLDGCLLCRAELERLHQLQDLLSEYRVPDAFSAANVFQAQVILKVARRPRERAGYRGAAWHLVPLALLSAVVILQALFVLFSVLWRVARSAQWLGIDPGLLVAQLGVAWPADGAFFGLSPSAIVVLLGAVLMLGLYLGVFALWVPYVGWVGALLRSSRIGQVSLGR